MHSMSDNLGYLKDQKRKIFLDPLGGSKCHPTPIPPKPSTSKVLALLATLTVTYLFFSELTLRVWWHV